MTGSAPTRRWSGLVQTLAVLGVSIAFIGAVALIAQTQPAPVDGPSALGRGGPNANDVNPEAEEQAEIAEERAEAFEEAEREAKVGQARPAAGPGIAAAAAGWAGEIPIDPVANDWEPAIAADPNAPWVYTLATRYAGKPCPGNCPTPWMALNISSDGGATWSAAKPLCACKGSGQFDPIIEVVPGPGPRAGNVYAAYMNGFNVLFTKSTDHGATWSTPVKTYGNVSWNDKPTIAVSNSGDDVYISFNGPTGGDPWMAQSHNAGATWTQTKLVDSNRYYFDFDSDVAPDGTVTSPRPRSSTAGAATRARPDRADRRARLYLTRSRRDVGEPDHRYGPAGDGVRRRGLHPGLLPRPHRPVCRRQRQPRRAVRRRDDGRRPPDDLLTALDRRRPDLGLAARALSGWRDVRCAGDRVAWRRGRPRLVLPDVGRRQRGRVERLVPDVHERRRLLGGTRQDLRCERRRGLQDRKRLRRGLRRLR